MATDPLPEGVVNALIYGTDSRDDSDFGGNTDAIVLAQLAADRSSLTLVSIARDTHLAGSGAGKINSVYARSGRDGLVKAVSESLDGLPIHVTAHTNFAGFIAITRLMEGIRVWNRNASTVTVQSTGRQLEFPEGDLKLENTDALIYGRQRYGLPLGDFDRAERHRALLIGIVKGLQFVQRKTPKLFGKLTKNLADRCYINGFDTKHTADLATPLSELDPEKITSLMLPVAGYGSANGQSVNVVNETRLKSLSAALHAADAQLYIDEYGADYAPTTN